MTETRKIKTFAILGLSLFAYVVGVKFWGSQNQPTRHAELNAPFAIESAPNANPLKPKQDPQPVYRKNDLEMPATEISSSENSTAETNRITKRYPIQLVTALEAVEWASETEAPPTLPSYPLPTNTQKIQSSIVESPVSLATLQEIVQLEPIQPKPNVVTHPFVPNRLTQDSPDHTRIIPKRAQRYPLIQAPASLNSMSNNARQLTGNTESNEPAIQLHLNNGQPNETDRSSNLANNNLEVTSKPERFALTSGQANRQAPSNDARPRPAPSAHNSTNLPTETRSNQLQTNNTFQLPEFQDDANRSTRVATASAIAAPKVFADPAQEPSDKTPSSLVGAENFVLAAQPQKGDHWKDDRPIIDSRAMLMPPSTHGFSPDPIDSTLPYDPYSQMQVYQGKTLNATQRPLVELGRPWYQLGQLSPGSSILGKHNNVTPQFLVYGDFRSAIASNTQNGDNVSQTAYEANLDFDLKLTGTERFHMFMSPLDGGGKNTRRLLDEDRFISEFDADIDFGYFEGDLGAIVGGFTNQTLPFDLPFAVGVMPLLLQNGVWMEDAFLGVAATIPARNSPRFNISNMDVTFFAGYDKIDSPAFAGDDSAARMYGMASFIEAMNGYFEIDYAFFDDRTFDDRSYHNFGFGFTRRFGRLLSNSTRVIVNAGQNSSVVENTADGVLLLSENSLITSAPSTLVPYANFFVGFDRPQSAARAAAAGGVLRNTGILFESDGMTDYPTLDPTANDTFGGALGLNLIADDFSQQLVVELAALGVMNEDANRIAPGPQYGIGFRYQLPLTNAMILRADGMMGFLEDQNDVRGLRFELRHKY